MTFEVKKGTSFRIHSVIYQDELTLANLVGATATAMLKKDATDPDASAVASYTIGSGIQDAGNSILVTTIPASATNNLSFQKLFFEILVKLADGTFIRSETDEINLKRNIVNTLI